MKKRIIVIFLCLLISCFFLGCSGSRLDIGFPPLANEEQGSTPPTDSENVKPPDEPNDGSQDLQPNPSPNLPPQPEPNPNPKP